MSRQVVVIAACVFSGATVYADSPACNAPITESAIQDSAVAILRRAESRIYQPERHGLESLAFRVVRDYAPARQLWFVDVAWNAASGVTATGSVSESAPIPQATRDQLQASLHNIGEVLAYDQLGRSLSYLQTIATAAVVTGEEGLRSVRFTPKPGSDVSFREKVLMFDENFLLRKARTIDQNGGALVETYAWRPLGDDHAAVVLDSVASSLRVGSLNVTRVTSYEVSRIDRWYLITGLRMRTSGIPNAPDRNEVMQLMSLVVNGQTSVR